MRDDFQPNIVRDLANRVGNRCSNPDCSRQTSGPTSSQRGSVSIGVAAHITAAAAGGPRYDPTLTQQQRTAIENGVWLCQTCSRLIDRDVDKYTKELLLDWRAGAERRAKMLLETPELPAGKSEPRLYLPETDPSVSWLAFSARATKFVGREKEATVIKSFLTSNQKFLWWVITGPAGTGKSRLALEICCEMSPVWHAGFFSKTEQFKGWAHFRPTRPTLIVLDYVASRADEIGDILLQVSQASPHLPCAIRILLLERDKGTWLSEILKEGSQSESAKILEHLHDETVLNLEGLAVKDLVALAKEINSSIGKPWTPSIESEFKRRMQWFDSLGRPLFAMMASLFLDVVERGLNTSLLDKVLAKESGRRRALVADPKQLPSLENLILLTTLVGGLVPRKDGFDFLKATDAKELLPDVSAIDLKSYCDLVSAPSNEPSLPGMQPDILGERFVLNKITERHPLEQSCRRLLLVAWAFQGAGLCDFIVRATLDFPHDPALAKLCDLPLDTPEMRTRWGRLVAEMVRVIGKSDSVLSQSMLIKLRALSDSFDGEHELRTECARAELYLGNILMFVDADAERALSQFQLTMSRAGAGSDMEASAINNRGIIHSQMKDAENAFKDWTKVIESAGASDEARACSLNNRADIFVDRGDHAKAIADRSSVLALKETSSDRRYIALIRRSRSYLATNQTDKALEDLAALLATDDIPPQQKAEALLQRGKIYTELNHREKAQEDFGEVLATEILFPGATEKALVGLAELARLGGDLGRAEAYLRDALESREIRSDAFVDGLIVTAYLMEDAGENEEALRLWQTILKDPRSSSEQRTIASKRYSPDRS